MKIIGKTLEGDLIIQVSQAEWDGLGDGVRPESYDIEWVRYAEEWTETDAAKLLGKYFHRKVAIRYAFLRGNIDGSIQSLRDIVDGKISVRHVDWKVRAKIKTLLNNHITQAEETDEKVTEGD